jgi:hypothetical protein
VVSKTNYILERREHNLLYIGYGPSVKKYLIEVTTAAVRPSATSSRQAGSTAAVDSGGCSLQVPTCVLVVALFWSAILPFSSSKPTATAYWKITMPAPLAASAWTRSMALLHAVLPPKRPGRPRTLEASRPNGQSSFNTLRTKPYVIAFIVSLVSWLTI